MFSLKALRAALALALLLIPASGSIAGTRVVTEKMSGLSWVLPAGWKSKVVGSSADGSVILVYNGVYNCRLLTFRQPATANHSQAQLNREFQAMPREVAFGMYDEIAPGTDLVPDDSAAIVSNGLAKVQFGHSVLKDDGFWLHVSTLSGVPGFNSLTTCLARVKDFPKWGPTFAAIESSIAKRR